MSQRRRRPATNPPAGTTEGVRAVGKLPLLFGWGIGPIVWSLHELLSEILISSACSSSANGFDNFRIAGVSGWRWVLLLLTLFFMLCCLAGAGVSFREWQRSRIGGQITGEVGGPAGRSGWLAIAGMMFSIVFLIGIVEAGIPIFFLNGCG